MHDLMLEAVYQEYLCVSASDTDIVMPARIYKRMLAIAKESPADHPYIDVLTPDAMRARLSRTKSTTYEYFKKKGITIDPRRVSTSVYS